MHPNNRKLALLVAAVAVAIVCSSVAAASIWRTAMPLVFNGTASAAQNEIDYGATVTAAQATQAALSATEAARQDQQHAAEQATQQALAEQATATIQALTDAGCTHYTPTFGTIPHKDATDQEYYIEIARVGEGHDYTGGMLIAPTWYNIGVFDDTWHTLQEQSTVFEPTRESFLLAARYQFSVSVCPAK